MHVRKRFSNGLLMRPSRLLSVITLALLAACADEGPVSGPGTMIATLLSPNGSEGAALVILLGDGVGAITSVGDTEVYSYSSNGSTRIVLINQVGGDLSFQVAVADTTQPPGAVVQEVAGPDDQQRTAISEYELGFVR